MASPFRTPQFFKLFKEWNRILEEDKFPDIEDFTRDEPILKKWETTRWNSTDNTRNELRQHYYEAADELLRTFRFKKEVHRRIWALHCQGLSPRKIEKWLKWDKLSKTTIYTIIAQIERESGLKHGRD